MNAARGSVPGPGAYETIQTLAKDGRYNLSRFPDSGSNALRSTAVRFGPQSKMQGVVPGPGRYEATATLNDKGTYFVSKYGASFCRKFSLSSRDCPLQPQKSTTVSRA